MSMKLEDLIEKFSAAVGIENVPAVEGVWKFSADGNVFGVTGDETGNVDSITEPLGGKKYRNLHRGGSDHVFG